MGLGGVGEGGGRDGGNGKGRDRRKEREWVWHCRLRSGLRIGLHLASVCFP